jgi:hypothetical protein
MSPTKTQLGRKEGENEWDRVNSFWLYHYPPATIS